MSDQGGPQTGAGLLQSAAEWAVRDQALASSLARLIRDNLPAMPNRGLDIGCQGGGLISQIAEETGLSWVGIDPILEQSSFTDKGAPIGPGRADSIPYPDAHFDAAVSRMSSSTSLPMPGSNRWTRSFECCDGEGSSPGRFPTRISRFEAHSRLPFMGYLPISLQRRYWRLTAVWWEHDFFVVTMRHLRRHATASGFRVAHSNPFNYPPEAIPGAVRPVARMAAPLMRVFPWAWQFVLVKPNHDGER